MIATPELVVGPNALGTPESAWSLAASLPDFGLTTISHAVIVAPHPDDEVLALGGLIRILRERGATITIVAVTDGEASHPHAHLVPGLLATTRAAERTVALAHLTSTISVRRLRLPDGGVAQESSLAKSLERCIARASHCFAPWELDGHPDHDACGRAAQAACSRTGVELVRYPVWAWHWTTPATFPWEHARRIELDSAAHAAKLAAIAAFRSQIAPVQGETVLPPQILARFQRPFEVVFV